MKKKHRIKAYLAFHSFGNKILYPWGHTSEKTEDWKDLQHFAKVAADAIGHINGAEERSFSDFFSSPSEPIVGEYGVSQQSLQDVSLTSIGSIRQSIRRVFLGEAASQTKEVNIDTFFLTIYYRLHAQDYSYGQAPDTVYRVTGGSDDWARGEAGIK